MSDEERDEGRDEEAPPRREDEEEFPSLDDMLGTFFSEPSLLPVVIVVLGMFVRLRFFVVVTMNNGRLCIHVHV